MEDRYIAAVDMGTWKIALTVAKISGEDVTIVYYKERPADGIKNSAVYNPMKAETPIRQAIAEAEDELKIKIMQVVVGLPRCDVRQMAATASVERRTNPDESITREEIESLKDAAREQSPIENQENEILYEAVAQSFSDDENFQLIENDIIGVISNKLDGNFKLFIGKKNPVRTIDKIFNDLRIAIARKYFIPSAQAKAVLTEDEMNGGVALIDFGAGATSVTIYEGKILRHYAAIPFGGNVITGDITSECGISPRLAEQIKYAFGACMPEKLQTLGEKTIQIEGNEIDGLKQIPVKYLSEIITARVREIIDAILYEIQNSGLADSLRNGVVLTGGGSNLCNIVSYIKEISGYNVRIGRSRHKISADGCSRIFEPAATASVGMILSAKDDNLLSCVDPVETSVSDVSDGLDVIRPETATTPQDTAAGTAAVEEAAPAIPEDAEEGEGGTLFPGEQVPEDPAKKPKNDEKKSGGTKKIGRLTITWKKILGFVDTMTNDIDKEQV